MEALSGNNILLIAPAYHNYYSKIALAFENLGAKVEYYSLDPTSFFSSNFYFTRLKKFSLFKRIYNYEVIKTNRKIIQSLKGKQFDHVVIIKGDLLSDDSLIQLKSLMPKANFVLYQWDSLKNYNFLHRIKYFNNVYSFDYADSIQYERIKYLPLFYAEEYAKIALLKNIKYEYDFFFLGFNHAARVNKLIELIHFCDENKLTYSINLMTTISEKIRMHLKKIKINCFFKSIKFNQFSEKYIRAKAIIDISPPQQTGLPIRIIEAVGANKKIITTNYYIINESFYDPKMIFIWGKDDLNDLVNFLNQEHKKSDCETYSIKSFALNLIEVH